jgi:hypothetical protein
MPLGRQRAFCLALRGSYTNQALPVFLLYLHGASAAGMVTILTRLKKRSALQLKK